MSISLNAILCPPASWNVSIEPLVHFPYLTYTGKSNRNPVSVFLFLSPQLNSINQGHYTFIRSVRFCFCNPSAYLSNHTWCSHYSTATLNTQCAYIFLRKFIRKRPCFCATCETSPVCAVFRINKAHRYNTDGLCHVLTFFAHTVPGALLAIHQIPERFYT